MLGTNAERFVLVTRVKNQIGGGMEVVFPPEMVGVILGLKPGGRLASHVEIENQFSEIAIRISEILSPFALDVKVADLIAKRDHLGLCREVGGLEQVDNQATGKNQLGIVLVGYDFVFQVIIMLLPVKIVVDARIEIEWHVVGVLLIT